MADDRVEWLRGSLERQISSFARKRRYNRSWAFALKLTTTSLAALTTIAVGLTSNPIIRPVEAWVSAAALILSASVTVVSAWEAFFDHRWLWVKYTSTLNDLYSISDDFGFESARGMALKDSAIDHLYVRLQDVLQDTNKAWSEKREKDGGATPAVGVR